jgi:muramoyltetrapeptide carboxypeptidase
MGLFGPSGPAAARAALQGQAVLNALGIGSSYVPAATVADPEALDPGIPVTGEELLGLCPHCDRDLDVPERAPDPDTPYVPGAAASAAGGTPGVAGCPPSAGAVAEEARDIGIEAMGAAVPRDAVSAVAGAPGATRVAAAAGPPPRTAGPPRDGSPGSGRAYLAGTDETRLMGVLEMMDNPGVSELLAVRGGFGAMRLLKDLTPFWHVFPRNKPIIGFSDVTALHLARLKATGTGGWHAPNLTTYARIHPEEASRAISAMKGEDERPWGFGGQDVLVPGVASGPLTGGNLTVFAGLWGSPYCPGTEGSLVLLEDVNEQPYAIDRLLTSLALRRAFKGAAGIVFGEFVNCGDPKEIRAILEDCAGAAGVPAVMNAPFGHGERCSPWYYGERGRLSLYAEGGMLEFPGRGPTLEIPEGFPVEMLI